MVDKEVTKTALKNIRDTYNDGKEIIVIMDNFCKNFEIYKSEIKKLIANKIQIKKAA